MELRPLRRVYRNGYPYNRPDHGEDFGMRITSALMAMTSFLVAGTIANAAATAPETAAAGVLARNLGAAAGTFTFAKAAPTADGCDIYEYEAAGGRVTVRGSSPSAMARGAYDYLKANGLGMVGWEGPMLRLPPRLPDAPKTRVETPFRVRHAYNVVTAGYTFPYWTWERWQQELDWQALHGFNMVMAPVATEAIATRVWKRLGLTQQEIDEFYTGPAHLPWQRMGNICQVAGTLPADWHADQVALQHKLLGRMRELGIEPVVQSFAGFVPKGIRRLYPEIQLHEMRWGGFPKSQCPVILMPGDPLFATITKMYMEEWEKEFGKAKYFLVDSFNEMELPKTDRPVTELLAEYGRKTFDAIRGGDPEAVWVIQGWMFGYQSHIWTPERVKALFSSVPDNEVLILDYANDYANNWGRLDSFSGKQWAYGFVPNMGGKTAYTGNMELYATGAGKMLASPKKKNLVGFTISGEGLENNAVLYELMADTAWSREPLKLDDWLPQYSRNRYGACPPAVTESWNLMRKGCYRSLTPHPSFSWQAHAGCGTGSVNRDPGFFQATQAFLSCAGTLGTAPGYRADAVERTALCLGLKAEEWFKLAADAYAAGDDALGDRAGKRGLELLTELDRLMESHPLNRLDRWIALARAHSTDPKLQAFYESNARRIVTVWGPPVNDYSCRVWSGLVRDFYRERMARRLDSLKTGKPFNMAAWELEWVNGSGVSKITPYADPVAEAVKLLAKACGETLPLLPGNGPGEPLGDWSPDSVTTEWKSVEWPLSAAQLKKLKGVRFEYTGGNHRLDIQSVSVVADGKVAATNEHPGFAGKPSERNSYKLAVPAGTPANNGAVIRAVVRGNGGTDSRGKVILLGE